MNKTNSVKKIAVALLSVGFAITLSGCSFLSESVPEPTVGIVYSLPRTEAEYRQSLSLISGEDAASLELKKNYLEALKDMDVFTEIDYRELAATYAKLGQNKDARALYVTIQKFFPAKENLTSINEFVMEIENDELAELDKMREVLSSLSAVTDYSKMTNDEVRKIADNVKSVVASESFKNAFCDGLVGVIGKHVHKEADYVCQITTDYKSVSVTFNYSDYTFHSVFFNEDGLTIFVGKYLSDAYNGKFTKITFNKNNQRTVAFDGSMTNDVLSGKLDLFIYDKGALDKTYSGKFNTDGTTKLEQYEALLEEGQLIYAVDEDKETYLFVENADKSYVFPCEFLGISKYEEWE